MDATPMWELVLASTLVTALTALTAIGWFAFFRSRRLSDEPRRKGLLVGLAILSVFLGMGAALFFLPAWVVPHHDDLGLVWFCAFPVGMLLSLACGIGSWRASGKTVVAGSIAGLSLWVLVVATVKI